MKNIDYISYSKKQNLNNLKWLKYKKVGSLNAISEKSSKGRESVNLLSAQKLQVSVEVKVLRGVQIVWGGKKG